MADASFNRTVQVFLFRRYVVPVVFSFGVYIFGRTMRDFSPSLFLFFPLSPFE